MLSEEGLIVVAGLVACGLVVLGTLELIAPTRPRHRRPQPQLDPGDELQPGDETERRAPLALADDQTAMSLDIRAASTPAMATEPGADAEPPIERRLRFQAEEIGIERILALAQTVTSQEPGPAPPAPAPETMDEGLTQARPQQVRAETTPASRRGGRGGGARGERRAGKQPAAAAVAPDPAAKDAPDWAACDANARRLADQGDFAAASQVLRDAVDDARCPEPVREALREALGALAGREAGLLTANAVRLVDGREDEAIAALDRAEAFLGALPQDGVPLRRRRELEQRLWWGYTKLGTRLVERERWDEALEPLLRALQFPGVGLDRQEETRDQLARAVDGLVDARAGLVARLIDEGDREGARAVCEMLRDVLDAAVERGLDATVLDASLNRTGELMERLGAPS